MSEREEFDRIVAGMEFDLDGLDDLDVDAPPAPPHEEFDVALEEDDSDSDEDITESSADAFYREVPPARIRPARGTSWAWWCLSGSAVILLMTAITGSPLPSSVMIALTLVSIASVIFLVSRLPERGPGQRDWPDDGAAL